jgi:AcrR family transcriptional regulator
MSKHAVILEAAIDVFAERGLHDTPVPSIARRANVAVGSLYRYFPGKEAMIIAVYRDILDGASEAAFGSVPEGAPARVRHRRVWFGLAEYFGSRPSAYRVMRQIRVLAPALPGVQKAQNDFEHALHKLLATAQASGELAGARLDLLRAHFLGPLFELLGEQPLDPSHPLDQRTLAACFDLTWNAMSPERPASH